MWSEEELVGGLEEKLGAPCDSDTDCSSSLGALGRSGRCVQASRAFCPDRCNRYEYRIQASSSAALSGGTAALLAARELALVGSRTSRLARISSSQNV